MRVAREASRVPTSDVVIDLLSSAPLIPPERLAAAFGPNPANVEKGVATARRFAYPGE
ncbi:hypothetical protein [Nocardia sp. IFM 10818]